MAGIAFSLLLTAAIVTIRSAVPANPNDAGLAHECGDGATSWWSP